MLSGPAAQGTGHTFSPSQQLAALDLHSAGVLLDGLDFDEMEATEEETGHADTLLEEFPDTEVEESTEAVEEPQAGSDLAELIAREEESAGAIETKGESAQAKVMDESHGLLDTDLATMFDAATDEEIGEEDRPALPEKREGKSEGLQASLSG